MTLLDLPEEILVNILSFLDISQITSFQRTSKSFHNLIRQSTVLQYLIETKAASIEDNPRYLFHLPLSERLERLRCRENAWARFETDFTMMIDVRFASSGIYDLTGGVYFLGVALGDAAISESLGYVVLPSTKPARELEWSHVGAGKQIVDVGVAMQEHDLVVLITTRVDPNDCSVSLIEVNLKQFSTNSYHPFAKIPVMSVSQVPSHQARPSASIEIVGNVLALLLIHHTEDVSDRLYLFDWKEGILGMEYAGKPGNYSCVVFLSEDVLLLPNLLTNALEIWRLPSSFTGELFPTSPLLVLQLPELADGTSMRQINCRGEPNPLPSRRDTVERDEGVETATHRKSGIQATSPFIVSSEDSILILDLLLFSTKMSKFRSVSFVVHRRSLLALLSDHSQPRVFAGFLKSLPKDPIYRWPTWGPNVTQWFETDDVPISWITTSCGQRYVQISLVPVTASSIRVRDFNPYTVRRLRDAPTELDNCYITVKDKGSDFEALEDDGLGSTFNRPFFNESVRGELPFVEFESKELFYFDGVLIDEERIIGLRVRAISLEALSLTTLVVQLDDQGDVASLEILHFG